jgi:hypothetical protein
MPGAAAARMHEAVRDLGGALRRGCASIRLPDYPAPHALLHDVIPARARLGARDDLPKLLDWFGLVEHEVRRWAKKHSPRPGDSGPRGKKPKAALEDRTDAQSQKLVSLYDAIVRARRGREGAARRALRLNQNRDLVDLARQVGRPHGITRALVRAADQFARDRECRQRRKVQMQK